MKKGRNGAEERERETHRGEKKGRRGQTERSTEKRLRRDNWSERRAPFPVICTCTSWNLLQSSSGNILIHAELPFSSYQYSHCSAAGVPVSGRKLHCSCIMGGAIENGEEDVVHACAINRVNVQSLLAANTEERSWKRSVPSTLLGILFLGAKSLGSESASAHLERS